jgi:UPF0716 protein FxsA
MLRFLVPVILVLALELALLVWLVHSIGWLATGGIALAAALVGGSFAKRQGRRVWRDWRLAATSGRLPELDALDPMLVLAGGVLLMLPGLLTDAVGLLLLVPAVRRRVAHVLRPWVARRSAAFMGSLGAGRAEPGATRGASVVDTEGEVVEGPRAERPQLR